MGMSIADVQGLGPDAQKQIFRAIRGESVSRETGPKGGNKYGAVACVVDGYRFDSKAEAEHYLVLKDRARRGEISSLRIQPAFPLIVNGEDVATYVADFEYVEAGRRVVADVKSKPTRTPLYRLKRKLLWACERIDVLEV